ncbi:MAG: hypothetical protein JW843_11550 [Candidatus Aminicenantes bacterium]|nr:hypothetical protein [Candidatus Aminicenantes bacterium]
MRWPFAGALLFAVLAGWCLAGQADLSIFVPAPEEAPGWTAKGEAQRFSGDDLYIYINGGAEIFNEYGFRRVLAQDFAHKDGRGVTLEIFEMSDAAAAFGIYSFQTSGKGRPAGLGTDGEVEEYYLRFWKGPYLVVATGFDPAGEGRKNLLEGVLVVARATDLRMKESAGRPAFCRELPAEWTGPGFKYLRGVLGLNNVHPFFPGDVFGFREAAAAPLENGWLFVFGYPGPEEAGARLAAVREAMAGDAAYRSVGRLLEGRFQAADSKENQIIARTIGNKIGLVFSPRAVEIADRLFSKIR